MNHYAYMMKVSEDREPETYSKAAEVLRWIEAMREEMPAFVVNNTWDLFPAFEATSKPIGCRWLDKIKHNLDNTINQLKARLVAKGYMQTHRIDYEQTFALVARMTTIHTMIRAATSKGWNLHQMDLKNAFL